MIKIIADAGCDLSAAEAEALGVILIPIRVSFGAEEYLSGVNLTNAQFYTKLKECKKLPVTSLINCQTYRELIETELSNGNQVFATCLSSGLSGSFTQLKQAAGEINSPDAQIYDCETVTFGYRILIQEAAKLVRAGVTLAGLKAQMEELKKRVRLYAVINDVTYLIKGGRLSAAAGIAATALHVKPIVTLCDKVVKVAGKTFGFKRAEEQLINRIKGADADREICFGHTACPDKLAAFCELVKRRTGLSSDNIFEVGPVVGTHVGPGSLGLAYFIKE